MHKIDWTRFKLNVKSFMEYRHMSWAEYSKQYVKKDPDDTWFCREQSVVDEWGKVVFNPTKSERDVLLRIMDAALGHKDESHFYESMEGDFCMAEVNLAGRLERGEGLNAGDCQGLAHYYEWIPEPLREKLAKFDGVPSIFTELLC